MSIQPFITTDRLYVRVWCEEDAEDFFRVMSQPAVHTYTQEAPWDLEKAQGTIRYCIRHRLGVEPGYFNNPLFLKETNEFLGRVGLNPFDSEKRIPEIEWTLAPAFWGKGYATEIGRAILRYAFEEAGFEGITGFAMPENKASCRVMEKIGMQGPQEKLFRGAMWSSYDIKKSDWFGS